MKEKFHIERKQDLETNKSYWRFYNSKFLYLILKTNS